MEEKVIDLEKLTRSVVVFFVTRFVLGLAFFMFTMAIVDAITGSLVITTIAVIIEMILWVVLTFRSFLRKWG